MKDQEIWHQYLELEEIVEAWEGGNGTTILPSTLIDVFDVKSKLFISNFISEYPGKYYF